MPVSRITVTQQSATGRNTRFRDEWTGRDMTLPQFVRAIQSGQYPDYHVRNINHVLTPVSNPDCRTNNNLG